MKVVVERSKRKTMVMRLVSPTELLIKAPTRVSDLQVNKFILSNQHWVEKQVVKFNLHSSHDWKAEYVNNGLFFVFGEFYKLTITKDSTQPKIIHKTIRVSGINGKELHKQVVSAYKKLAKKYFQERLDHCSQVTSFVFSSWRLKNNKTNWGSCSSKKNINLNWRLIMAPHEVIDYVIIHELCHLKQMNHSDKFWSLVERFDPSWKEHSNWLKVNGYLLHAI
jgi:predicted metal-dependent hydrolase